MVNVSDDLKSAFLTGRQKNLTLNFYKNNVLVDTLTPDAIVMESMEIQQLLCSEAQLTFGLCNAAEFRVEIFNGSVSHNGLIVKPVISTHDDEDVEYTFDLGIYKVVEDVVSDDRNTRTITAYDALYDVVNNEYSEWYKSLTMPMTLKQFRDAFFSNIGITQATINLPNDGMEIKKTIETNNLSGATILKAILEINASFGFIDYTGTFRYTLWTEGTGLFPAEDLYPSPDLYPVGVAGESIGMTEESAVVLDTLVYADYVVREITGVLIQTTSTDIGTLVGTNTNVYPILSNFLLYDKSSSDLQTIGHNFLRYADQLYYRPSRFQVRCHPWIELGDFLSVNASQFRVTLPVLQRTITGITALYDEFEAQGSEIYTTQANNLTTMTENLYRKSLEIIESTDEFKVEMHDELYGEGGVYSKISQTAHTIGLTITNSQDNTSAGIVIQLYDENGDPITQSGGNTGNINLTGLVKFTDLSGTGTTTINGSNITTGTIDASRVNVTNINASNITSGSISGNRISGGTINGVSITAGQGISCTSLSASSVNGGSQVSATSISGGNIEGQVVKATSELIAMDDLVCNNLGHGTTSDYFVRVTSGGKLVYTSTPNTDSSRRVKYDIKDVENADLDPHKLLDLKVRQFKYNAFSEVSPEKQHKDVIGLIAEEVDEVYPVATVRDRYGNITNWEAKYIIPGLISLIQEQEKRIQKLESIIKEGKNNDSE